MKFFTLTNIGSFPLVALFALILAACDTSRPANGTARSRVNQEAAEQTPDAGELNPNLIAAAAAGDLQSVQRLIDQGADVHTADSRGMTPLIAAAYQNHLDVARLLIEAGADVNRKDDTQQSAYLISTSEGYLDLLRLTLANGADVHSLDSYNGTGLIRAADRGHVEIIEELLKTGIEIDHINRLGWTALLEAIILGDGGPRHTEVVRLLVDAGADVNQGDGGGVTALEHARQRGFAEIVRILEGAAQSQAAPTTAVDSVSTALEPTPAPTAVPSPTPHPLYPHTIPGLRQRNYPGGPIQVRAVLQQNEAYTLSYMDYPSDDLAITGLLYVPEGEGPFPVLILLHGYFERGQYYAGADTSQAADFFARNGYLVLAPDLRSWGESGSDLSLFHTGLVIDVLNLISALPSLPQADTERIGLWGHSMGGGITTKVLTIDKRVKAAVLYAPNSADDADLIGRWGPGCLPSQSEAAGDHCNPAEVIPPDTPQELIDAYLSAAANPEFLRLVAPIYHLEAITAPVQIHIGTADGQGHTETPVEWSLKLSEALQDAGRDVETFTYEGQGHFFSGQSWTDLLSRSLAFFNERVRQ